MRARTSRLFLAPTHLPPCAQTLLSVLHIIPIVTDEDVTILALVVLVARCLPVALVTLVPGIRRIWTHYVSDGGFLQHSQGSCSLPSLARGQQLHVTELMMRPCSCAQAAPKP